jgi:Xaa-Pro aminopeptidase
MVSVDTMVSYHGYLNDQTRNYAMGSPAKKLLEAYSLIRDIHERFKDLAKPGAITGELFNQVWEWVREAGWAEYFMGCGEPRISFVAHGIGLEVDEFPFIARGHKLPLREGMTLAFEPKFVIPGLGMAGLENTYLVTEKGLRSFNTATEELVTV